MSFAVIVHYRAQPGQERRVREALTRMIAPSRAEPGNLLYEVCADPSDSAAFSLYERYIDGDAFTAHAESPHFARWLKGEVLPCLVERERHDLTAIEPEPVSPAAVSTASVRTDRPGRYGKQLVSHLSRRTTGEWAEESATGRIDFTDGRADLSCGENTLQLRVETTPEHQERLESVVGRHLVRFGARDELVVRWTRADGTPGTEQRNEADE
ncbi:DUF2218 domain-containing protein [Actinomadura sp. DC4]|uniref:DUF2218 domain-containing protein n=1 Tax=Actinomadura sp. DC4 TaxID=3055069 RepID=UPI0025B1410C|nr:DUF2218 domain-containing protein [Actinomadura sp. DC4]MDN3359090.1 DUF2218 domain-containing protein [Actinomadura sp. DC4]